MEWLTILFALPSTFISFHHVITSAFSLNWGVSAFLSCCYKAATLPTWSFYLPSIHATSYFDLDTEPRTALYSRFRCTKVLERPNSSPSVPCLPCKKLIRLFIRVNFFSKYVWIQQLHLYPEAHRFSKPQPLLWGKMGVSKCFPRFLILDICWRLSLSEGIC